MKSVDRCGFCGEEAELMDSHVLPAFVFRWLRGRSGTGHIRHTENPNRRVQDGLKFPWLCSDCEAHFNKYETAFATKVFHPWHQGVERVAYQDWMLKFCVSVSWRVLQFARGRNPESNYTAEQEELMDQAEARWRSFLNGEAPHPGEFEQHLVIFDIIEDTTVSDLPSNINRFLTGAITLDIVGSSKSLMTFAKMGRFTVFGIIQKGPDAWEGTRVKVRNGVLKPGHFVLPAGIIDLLKDKAASMYNSMEEMSSAQRAKIDKHIEGHLEDFRNSEQFGAITADVERFGIGALRRREK